MIKTATGGVNGGINRMFTIGQFSKICRVTTKTLRHYDEIGLLKPAQTEPLTQYRYYSIEQFEEYKRISLLKDLGFALDDIKKLLKQPLDSEKMENALKEQACMVEQQMETYKSILAKIKRELDSLKGGKNMLEANQINRPQIKEIPAARVVALRDKMPYYKVGELYDALHQFIETNKLTIIGAPFSIYHDNEYRPDDADIEACFPVVGDAVSEGRIEIKAFPSVQVVSMLHIGPYEQVSNVYASLLKYINENNLTIADSSREIYLVGPVGVPEEKYVTEVLFPIEK